MSSYETFLVQEVLPLRDVAKNTDNNNDNDNDNHNHKLPSLDFP